MGYTYRRIHIPNCEPLNSNNFLNIICTNPTVAAKNAVKDPNIVINVNVNPEYSNKGEHLINKNIPAISLFPHG